MLHNVNCQQPFSICNKWFTLVGLIVGGSHAKVGGTRNQIASITVLHPCPLAQLTGKILNNRHQSRNTKKAMVAVTNKRWNSNTIFNVSCVGGSRPRRLIRPWTLESITMRRKIEGGNKMERGQSAEGKIDPRGRMVKEENICRWKIFRRRGRMEKKKLTNVLNECRQCNT